MYDVLNVNPWDEGNEVASIQGEGDDPFLLDSEADRAATGLQRRRLPADLHGLGEIADGQREIQRDLFANAQRQPAATEEREKPSLRTVRS